MLSASALAIAGLAGLRSGAAQGRAGAELPAGFFPVHYNEPLLLHRRLALSLFQRLLIWDDRYRTWRPPRPEDVPRVGERGTLTLINLWADWCAPCRDEFPILRGLSAELARKYKGRVQGLWISATTSPSDMAKFLDEHRKKLPAGAQYLDTGEAVATALREGLANPWSLPVTLLLDDQGIVRHAIVGRITGRLDELRTAIANLLSLASTR